MTTALTDGVESVLEIYRPAAPFTYLADVRISVLCSGPEDFGISRTDSLLP
jgi:hypothetical protein